MRAVSVENLLGQVSDDIVGDLRSLPLNNKCDELSQVFGQVVLIVQQLNDLCVVLALHVLDLTSILLHAQLQHVKEHLLKVFDLCVGLVMLQEIEASLDEAFDEVLFNLLLRPE